jgi:multidrug resistance protein
MSETFGRRPVFLTNLIIFTLLQIPTAFVKNLPALVAIRTITGFFGSVGVANGGGTISDMFPANERAGVLGFYLLGPLIGPSIGPFLGGLINANLDWRWIIWIVLIMSAVLSTVCYFCLFETYAPMVLEKRKKQLQQKEPDVSYKVEGASDEPIMTKVKAVCRTDTITPCLGTDYCCRTALERCASYSPSQSYSPCQSTKP